MKLTKEFTRREKVLLVILALVLLFAVYFLAVHRPVTEGLDRIQMESETVSADLMVLEAKQQRMEQMQAELDEILAQPNVAEIPDYDNLQQVMVFLNTVLSSASEYTLNFQGLQQPDDGGILRRTMQMTFVSTSYDVAKSMIEYLQNCPYRCQLSDFSIVPAGTNAQSAGNNAALLDGPVQVSMTVTFYEKHN